MSKELTLEFQKSTKNTHVYNNDDYRVTFYCPKVLIPGQPPAEIIITITPKESK